ncbi:MAG: hypothetical protein Q8Q60_02720 [Candidatus Chromulinivorax sp.]|nr:hypothetical protein [Candidatus Chromulinivorax sp.]
MEKLRVRRSLSVLGLIISFLYISPMISCQQDIIDAMSKVQLVTAREKLNNRIEILQNRQNEAIFRVNELFPYLHQKTIQYYPDKVIILPSQQDILLHAAQLRQLTIEDCRQKVESINKNLETKFSIVSLNDSSQDSVMSLDQTTNASNMRSDRSFSISTTHETSSISSIASDDFDESLSLKTLNSVIIKNNIDTKIKVKQAYELSLLSQQKYDVEKEIALKKKEALQLEQNRAQQCLVGIAHKAQKIIKKQDEAQQRLIGMAKAAIKEEKKLYQELQKDEKAFLNQESRLLQSLKDKSAYELQKLQMQKQKVVVVQRKAYRVEAQQQSLYEKSIKQHIEIKQAQRLQQDAENKFLEEEMKKEAEARQNDWYNKIYTDIQQQDITMQTFEFDVKEFIQYIIVNPAIRLSQERNHMDSIKLAHAVLDRAEITMPSHLSTFQRNYFVHKFQEVYELNSQLLCKINATQVKK